LGAGQVAAGAAGRSPDRSSSAISWQALRTTTSKAGAALAAREAAPCR
jgi:hypothetical protein